MKLSKFFIAASLFTSVTALASDFGYVCKQRTERTPIDPALGEITVTVKHIKNIATATEYRGEYMDSVDVVKVDVLARKDGTTRKLKSVKAIAASEDVHFGIDNNGISFYLYMDELEEAEISLKINGKKKVVALACDFDTPPSMVTNPRSSLIVNDEGRMISVAWLIKEGIDVQASYGYDKFCYKGDSYQVANQIKTWNREGVFFSGGGGGFELKEVDVIRGIVTYDIRLKLEDEVVPGEMRTVLIKPCK